MVIAFTGTRGLPYRVSSDRLEYTTEISALQLTKRNHSVHVLTDPEYSDLDSYQGISLHPTKDSTWSQLWALQKIKGLDVVHVMSLDQAPLVALISLFMPQVRLIFEAHDYHTSSTNRRKQWQILNRVNLVCRFADQIVVDRVDLQDFFVERTTTPVHLVPQPLDIHLSRQNGSIKTWNLSRRKYIVLHSHQTQDQKNLKLLLISLAKAKLNYTIVVIGTASPTIKDQFQSPTVLFVGAINGQTEREIISNARWFIETSSNAEDKTPLLMALCHATPVVVEQSEIHQTLVGRKGLYYTRENLASMMHVVTFAEDAYDILSEFSYKYAPEVRDNHAVENHFNSLISIYVNAFAKKQTQQANQLQKASAQTQ